MFRSTGLDIGSTATRRVSVGQYWGVPALESADPINGPVITNVSADKLTYRRVKIPFAGREVQSNVVGEELQYSLPFSCHSATWDWVAADEWASVMVAFNSDIKALRSKVGKRVSLDAEPLSLLRACLESKCREALIFDFGASHTTICAIKDGALDWVKVSLRGGNALNERLAKAHEFEEEQAEEHKRAVGCADPVCQQWLEEIVNSCVLELPLRYEKVFICGGGAAMPLLRETLQEKLAPSGANDSASAGASVSDLAGTGESDHDYSEFGVKVELFPLPQPLNAYEHVMAYGAALAGKPRRPKIQLSPVERESAGSIKLVYAFWIIALLILGTCDLELRHATLVNAQAQHRQVIATAIEEQAPDLKGIDPEKLSEEVEKRLAHSQYVSLNSPTNYLATMGALSKVISNMQGIEVRNLDFHADNSGKNTVLSIDGLADSAALVEELRSSYDKVLVKAELLESRAGANNTTRYCIEGQLRQQ